MRILRQPPVMAILATLALLPFATAHVQATEDKGSRKPNILVIMTDEHNANVLGCYGNKIIHTPNLDALAAQGVLFENDYCNSPLCVPSRSAFTSCKYISRTGSWGNNTHLPPDTVSIARVMNQAGYDSALCGKMHYDARYRFGFRQLGKHGNGGQMTGTQTRRDPDDLTPKKSSGGEGRFDEFHPGNNSVYMSMDRKTVSGAQEFFKSRKPGDKPFFFVCGLVTPHFPLIVPEPYWRNYQGKVPMPVVPPGYLDSLPLNYKELRVGFRMTDVPPDVVEKGRELYYGLTQWMDERVGAILAALRASGDADNTVIIYTTDHGENMGEHGLWWKNVMFDTAARIPLIVSWPARWKGGQRRTQVCSMVDVVQTIAQLGGAKTPGDWNGTSLCSLLDDPQTPWKDMAVAEYYGHNIASGFATIRLGQFKYVYHTAPDAKHPAQRELYDLETDPGELKSLAGDPSQAVRIRDLHERLVKEIGEDPEKTERRCRHDSAVGYGDAAEKQKKTGKHHKEEAAAP